MTPDLFPQSIPAASERKVKAEFPLRVPCALALVGDAPGVSDVAKLRPFDGSAGHLLNSMLRAAGIKRDECFVGNVFETALDQGDPARHRALIGEKAWQELWAVQRARLHAELVQAQPTVVVPMGRLALLALQGSPQIGALRGSAAYGVDPFQGWKMVPTFHPTHVMKVWKMFAVTIGDLIRAAEEAKDGPLVSYPKRELIIAPSIEEVEDLCHGAYQKADLLSCDIETGWGQIRGVAFAPSEFEALYVPFVALSRTNRCYWYTPDLERRAWLAVKALLESETPKLGQNFNAYDIPWLLGKAGIRPRNVAHDLRLLHAALYPELPKSLAFMGATYSRQGAWKTWAKHGGQKIADTDEKRDA